MVSTIRQTGSAQLIACDSNTNAGVNWLRKQGPPHYAVPLDLTVSVLRRISTNVVDRFTPEGQYVRAVSGFPSPVIVRATQRPDEDCLSSTIESDVEQDS